MVNFTYVNTVTITVKCMTWVKGTGNRFEMYWTLQHFTVTEETTLKLILPLSDNLWYFLPRKEERLLRFLRGKNILISRSVFTVCCVVSVDNVSNSCCLIYVYFWTSILFFLFLLFISFLIYYVYQDFWNFLTRKIYDRR